MTDLASIFNYYTIHLTIVNTIKSERCWGILELHWNGTLLRDVETMLAWAKSMTWKGLHPIVNLSMKGYQKGITLSKKTMRSIEKRLERNPLLPKWDILIRPAGYFFFCKSPKFPGFYIGASN